MRRADLEHTIRVASQIADDDEIIVIGSQSVLGQYANREKDLVDRSVLVERLATLPVDDDARERIRTAVAVDFS